MRRNVKKVLSLTLILSIFAQFIAPGIMPSVKAEESNPYFFGDRSQSITKDLELLDGGLGEKSAVVSWRVEEQGSYILEYYVEDTSATGDEVKAQKIQLTFDIGSEPR